MTLRFLDFVEPIVGHAIFRDRLDQAEVSLTAAPRAAESFGAIVDIVQAAELQRRVSSADIAAQPHLPVGLGERAEGEGAMRPRSNHGARLAAAGRRLPINSLPAVLADLALAVAESATRSAASGTSGRS